MKFLFYANIEFEAEDIDQALERIGVHLIRASGVQKDAIFIGELEIKPKEE